VAFTSASSTPRTKFRSLDHRRSKHWLLYSPEMEYLDSVRSNAMMPSSTTPAACALEKDGEHPADEFGVTDLNYSPR
jgi:hypothetical protein